MPPRIASPEGLCLSLTPGANHARRGRTSHPRKLKTSYPVRTRAGKRGKVILSVLPHSAITGLLLEILFLQQAGNFAPKAIKRMDLGKGGLKRLSDRYSRHHTPGTGRMPRLNLLVPLRCPALSNTSVY